MERRRLSNRPVILVGLMVAAILGPGGHAMAQALKDVRTPDTPLVLKAQGSFFVGGDKVVTAPGTSTRSVTARTTLPTKAWRDAPRRPRLRFLPDPADARRLPS
jgi:hypothetical protein